ncbi:NADH dehydrogenase [ubiquinone] iron-sulfur protein 5-B-like isoform X1 [Wolffia australiana]
MASGWGITGNKGRCYDFWNDFSECMSRCREPKDCALLREDYLECLHHSKEIALGFLVEGFFSATFRALEGLDALIGYNWETISLGRV